MTPELKAIVEEAYVVFGRYKPAAPTLTVCHCNVCMTQEVERELIKTPLREIPSLLLAEYTNSAHDWDDGPVAREMRYFLPRYFELIALNDPPDNMDLDICLRRLGKASWRAKWPKREEQIIDQFFDALMISSLQCLDLAHWPVGWKLDFQIEDVLTMVITAHGDVGRVLAAWDHSPDPQAAIHMAGLREHVLTSGGRTYLHSAYLEGDYDAEADKIGAFLMRPEVDRRLEAAFFAVADPRLQQILSDAMQT
jgi:hypothetical protein